MTPVTFITSTSPAGGAFFGKMAGSGSGIGVGLAATGDGGGSGDGLGDGCREPASSESGTSRVRNSGSRERQFMADTPGAPSRSPGLDQDAVRPLQAGQL